MAMLVLASAGQRAQAPALGVGRRRGKLPRLAEVPSGLRGRRTRLLTSLQLSSRFAAMSFKSLAKMRQIETVYFAFSTWERSPLIQLEHLFEALEE
ncbi:hypothetical protein XH97_05830 [Bradyrhizobium sp. CCBAU 53380]|nr:hypothetical protein [Bradyrhizobium sp. CCBAU 53380]